MSFTKTVTTSRGLGATLLILIPILLLACSNPLASAPTATPTPLPPTATQVPSPTPIPPTATYTPVPTRTPTVPVTGGEPTATWTPVPGNPRWSLWRYQNLVFELPVAWRKASPNAPGGNLYESVGGTDRSVLLVSVEKAQPGLDTSRFAQSRLGLLRSALEGFGLVVSGKTTLLGGQTERYGYKGLERMADGATRKARGVAFYMVRDGLAVSLEFTAEEKRFGEWEEVFNQIAASATVIVP